MRNALLQDLTPILTVRDGENAASLESLIRDIVAGKVKHKQKIALSDADIANVAAYWGQGRD